MILRPLANPDNAPCLRISCKKPLPLAGAAHALGAGRLVVAGMGDAVAVATRGRHRRVHDLARVGIGTAAADAVARILGGEELKQRVIYVPTKLVTSANAAE